MSFAFLRSLCFSCSISTFSFLCLLKCLLPSLDLFAFQVMNAMSMIIMENGLKKVIGALIIVVESFQRPKENASKLPWWLMAPKTLIYQFLKTWPKFREKKWSLDYHHWVKWKPLCIILKGKQMKAKHQKSNEIHTTQPLELLHMDLREERNIFL